MKLPSLTHLQFSIIDALRSSFMTAPQLKEMLGELDETREGSSFYSLLNRMTNKGIIKKGKKNNTLYYSITDEGKDLYNDCISFYAKNKLSIIS